MTARAGLKRLAVKVGRLLSPGRLPNLLIIGAQKAGTTSLFNYLSQHPQIRASIVKEVHFFDNGYDRGLRWYRSHFPAGREPVIFEASPYYLFHPLAPARAAGAVPDARLIVLLRDPVARAYSHYRHNIARGRETLDFEAALACEEERLGASADELLRGLSLRDENHRHFSYRARGLYGRQIEAWLRHFPFRQFHFIASERLFQAPQAELDRVHDFLGIDPFTIEDTRPRNRRSYPPMDERIYAKLAASYADSNALTERLTGISLP